MLWRKSSKVRFKCYQIMIVHCNHPFPLLYRNTTGRRKSINRMSWLTDESPLVRGGEGKSQVSFVKWTGRSATRESSSFISSLLLVPTLILPTGDRHIVLTEANRDPCLSFLWLYPWRQRYGGLPVRQVPWQSSRIIRVNLSSHLAAALFLPALWPFPNW